MNNWLTYAVSVMLLWGVWGAFVHVERNHWLPTELSRELEPGALDIGLGAEYLAAADRSDRARTTSCWTTCR